ncbi:MAG: hypothetical protein J5594_00980 [Elusimicrobiaceae bacterium]|nr:hypothetical protein [Elusimicrobiaceae bacterium]
MKKYKIKKGSEFLVNHSLTAKSAALCLYNSIALFAIINKYSQKGEKDYGI